MGYSQFHNIYTQKEMKMVEVVEAAAAFEPGFTKKIKSSAVGQKIASTNDLQKAFDRAVSNLIGKEITQVMMVERAIGLLSAENKAEIDKSLNHIETVYRDKKAALLDSKVTEHCKTPDALLGLERLDAARLNESRDIIRRYATMYDSNRQITLSDEAIDRYTRAQRFGGREALVSQIEDFMVQVVEKTLNSSSKDKPEVGHKALASTLKTIKGSGDQVMNIEIIRNAERIANVAIKSAGLETSGVRV